MKISSNNEAEMKKNIVSKKIMYSLNLMFFQYWKYYKYSLKILAKV